MLYTSWNSRKEVKIKLQRGGLGKTRWNISKEHGYGPLENREDRTSISFYFQSWNSMVELLLWCWFKISTFSINNLKWCFVHKYAMSITWAHPSLKALHTHCLCHTAYVDAKYCHLAMPCLFTLVSTLFKRRIYAVYICTYTIDPSILGKPVPF